MYPASNNKNADICITIYNNKNTLRMCHGTQELEHPTCVMVPNNVLHIKLWCMYEAT